MVYERISTKGLSREQWLELRKTGIGGSDAGAVLGVNMYRSPLAVYLDKTSSETEPKEDNEAMRVGRDLEEYVSQRFTEATGLKVRRSNFMYRSLKYPYLIADIDRMVVGEEAILECKTVSAFGADGWADGDIPPSYRAQMYHYMVVTGKRRCYIACLIMGIGFVYRCLEWDDEIVKYLIKKESDFWLNYVISNKMPPTDGSDSCDEIISGMFPRAENMDVVDLDDLEEKLVKREEILETVDELKKEASAIDQEIKLALAEREYGESGQYRVTWGNVESTRLNTKKLRSDHPEIYAEYSEKSNTRRFQIKKIQVKAA